MTPTDPLTALAAQPWLWQATALLVGLILGGFATVAADRLGRLAQMQDRLGDILGRWQAMLAGEPDPGASGIGLPDKPLKNPPTEALKEALTQVPAGLSIAHPSGSRCDQCGRPLGWRDKLPVLGWILTRGRCAACGHRVSPALPVAEGACAVAFGAAAALVPDPYAAVALMGLSWFMVALALADHLHEMLPDALTFPCLWGGLLVSALGLWPVPPDSAIIGAAAAYLGLTAIGRSMGILLGRAALGGGDIMLVTALGAWLGWEWIIPVVAVGALVSLLVALGRAIAGDKGWRQNRFGPALAGTGLATAFLVVLGIA